MPESTSEITLEDGRKIKVSRLDRDGRIEISLILENGSGEPCFLHWGLATGIRGTWNIPPREAWPKDSMPFGETAIQSPFLMQDGVCLVVIGMDREVLKELGLNVISFVIYYPGIGRWDNNHGKNYYVRLTDETPTGLSPLMAGIVEAETGDHSWSLMHRFNLCHDLLDGADPDGCALLYVWMRFSAIRQLTWQRRYNTKPRELSHAQDRLTLKLASVYRERPELREIIRLLMGTVGRGGEGQRVRDEILNIMHRHRIKEVAGSFLEEWHQKLHNNTTPDDIVICEAYLEFLRSGGDLAVFYRTLEKGGVTRMRLKGFERPIVTDPDFIPFLKDALIADFQYFLGVLRAVHSATDLDTAFSTARHLLGAQTADPVAFVLQNKEGPTVELALRITDARKSLLGDLQSGVRELLYLDLALEEFLRVIVERRIGELTESELFELTGVVLENMLFPYTDIEFSESLIDITDIGAIGKIEPYSPDWALRARAVLERLMRALGAFADRHYRMFQPKAEVLGKAFKAEAWTVALFSEELIRGTPAFVLSMLLRRLDPFLRRRAQIGKWQVINPGEGKGRVEAVDELRSIQGKSFTTPTVIVAESVKGDEEPPAGVIAIITPDAVDLVAHVSVRTRQARLLFATCYDREALDELKSLTGHFVNIAVSPSGDVEYEKIDEERKVPLEEKIKYIRVARPAFFAYAIGPKDYAEGLVGGKSYNLKSLGGLIPEWIGLPVSVTIPYGVFEHVLEQNPEAERRYMEAAKRTEDGDLALLDELKAVVLSLDAPPDMMPALNRMMTDSGLPWPEWPAQWNAIKRVWASKWNERAYLSRKRWGFPHEELYMAVLIQEVISADYAFVIHTVNPVSGDRGELYAEVVPGLGETLVGNYPGRALGFSARKESPTGLPATGLAVVSYPSKSIFLRLPGRGLIFRSDANAEDLPGYAGAGLYDSIMLPEPEEATIRYSKEPLLWDEGFRNKLLASIVEAGAAVERATGSPQDIEGVYSAGKLYVVQTRPQMGL